MSIQLKMYNLSTAKWIKVIDPFQYKLQNTYKKKIKK